MNVSVVGLGKLGCCMMANMATRHHVVGVDLNALTVEKVNLGKAPVEEPGLQELLTVNQGKYRATTDTMEVRNTDITFVIVPTPSGDDGAFKNDHVIEAVEMIGHAVKDKERHVVVIVSTVMPGATQGPIGTALDKHADGANIGLAYSPEFIALGSVIHDLQNPDMLLVGAEEDWVFNEIEHALRTGWPVPIARLTTVEAEIAKIAINTYVTMKISFANMIGEVCDRHANTNSVNVTNAIGMDSRIGTKYLRPATGFGGPCFPRDNEAFIALAPNAALPKATIEINDRQVHALAAKIGDATQEDWGVSVLGLTYKPDTPVVERSFGIDLVNQLSEDGYVVTVFDPILRSRELRTHFNGRVKYADSAQECIDANIVSVLVQPCDEFKTLDTTGKRIIDPWGIK